MIAGPVAHLLSHLGVTRSHSRPTPPTTTRRSESQFKTMKYRPDDPRRFGCYEDARAWCERFFRWYNHEHRHSGIGLHTPADVDGRAEELRAHRAEVLAAALRAHPERLVQRRPEPPRLRAAVRINPPEEAATTQ
nr:integrase core domain-containing protein [Acidimicrobium ferrooxidans]